MAEFTFHRLDASREADFFRVLACDAGAASCACSAWLVPTWKGFSKRDPADNRALRDARFRDGAHDGYLAYAGGEPVAWSQVAPRPSLPKVEADVGDLAPSDAGTWSITCFAVHPEHRRRGVARALLGHILADLPARGARRVLAFPKRGSEDPAELWNGPEGLFRDAGFRVLRDDDVRPVLMLEW